MTLHTYATMLEQSHNRLQKSVFHVDDTSDLLQYSALAKAGGIGIPAKKSKDSTTTKASTQKYVQTTNHRGQGSLPNKRVMSLPSSSSSSLPPQQPLASGSHHNLFNNGAASQLPVKPVPPPPLNKINSVENESDSVDDEDDEEENDSRESPEIIGEIGKKPIAPPAIKPLAPPPPYHRLHLYHRSSPLSSGSGGGGGGSPSSFWRPPTNHFILKRRLSKRSVVTRGLRRYSSPNSINARHGNGIMASAYSTRVGSEFTDEHHDPPEPGNVYFVIFLLCLLIACAFTVTFMLLPFRSCPRNHHVPVLIWSLTILCSVACNVESSVHPRLALGWILLETFLIWITLPLKLRTALFYTTTLAVVYIVVMGVRERARPWLGRQVSCVCILV